MLTGKKRATCLYLVNYKSLRVVRLFLLSMVYLPSLLVYGKINHIVILLLPLIMKANFCGY